jgi:isocitrate/isopropylmalate dehydrogenase
MLKEEMDAAAKRHPNVRYEPQLIDATYALLMVKGGEALAIPALNRDGDCLSDLVLQMFGSIAGSESLVLGGFDDDFTPRTIMAEAPHGTAPSLQGKNLANPLAMILAGAALLQYIGEAQATRASRAIYESAFEAIYDGIGTPDLGLSANTTEFTDEVIRRVEKKLEVWDTLG